jgi:transcriptional regulator with XRE-family HTH domain
MTENFGERLRRLRKSRQLSQRQLADLCDTTQGYIADLETLRNKNPSSEMIARISRVLNVSLEELIGQTGGALPPHIQEFSLWLVSINANKQMTDDLTKIADIYRAAVQANRTVIDDTSEKKQFYQQLETIVEQLRNSVETNSSETMSLIDSLAALLKEQIN